MRLDPPSPPDLSVPQDDGACDHLSGAFLPAVTLRSSAGREVRLSEATRLPTVIFAGPLPGHPDEPADGPWDAVPGPAGGPAHSGLRDLLGEFSALGVQVFALSTQRGEVPPEAAGRLGPPVEVLGDADLRLTEALALPTCECAGARLLRRMAWFCEFGRICKVFYPLFPPGRGAAAVLAWLLRRRPRPPLLPTRLLLPDGFWIGDVTPADDGALLHHLADKHIHDVTLAIPYPYTVADADWWINRVSERAAWQGRATSLAVRDPAGQLIGGIGFDALHIGRDFQAELGYWLARPFWGRGLMTAAVRAVTSFAFAELGVDRVTANVFDFNTSSARVLQRAGFVLEGILRGHHRKEGRALDGWLYARRRLEP